MSKSTISTFELFEMFPDAEARSILWALGGHFDCTQGRTLKAAVRAALG